MSEDFEAKSKLFKANLEKAKDLVDTARNEEDAKKRI